MGLHVVALGGLMRVAEPVQQPGDHEVVFYDNPDFPGRCAGIDGGATYRYRREYSFSAGSYGTYNVWRNRLAKLAGYAPMQCIEGDHIEWRYDRSAWQADGGPFFELINFSDCEGTLGPVVVAKLAQDFAAFQAAVDLLPPEAHVGSYRFASQYANWRRALDLAAQDGAIKFS